MQSCNGRQRPSQQAKSISRIELDLHASQGNLVTDQSQFSVIQQRGILHHLEQTHWRRDDPRVNDWQERR